MGVHVHIRTSGSPRVRDASPGPAEWIAAGRLSDRIEGVISDAWSAKGGVMA